MRNTLKLFAGVALGLLAYNVGAQGAKDDIVVIVNKGNPVRSLSRDELRPIFQTTKTQWPDGNRIAPFQLPEADSIRHGFDAAVLGLDPDRVARYWVDRKIRGGERPPAKLSTPAAIARMVGSNAAGIGYVAAADATPAVKVVARIHNGEITGP